MGELHVLSVLVTGANWGISLGLVQNLLGMPSPPSVGLCSLSGPHGAASEVQNLVSRHRNLVIILLEVTDPSSIKVAAVRVGEHLGALLDNETLEDMTHVYTTNTIWPLLMDQAFLPLLKKVAQGSPGSALSCSRAAIINMSSYTGSITDVYVWEYGQVVSYHCSKAALNMLTKCQSLRYKEDDVLCTALHPGWVQTNMGGSGPHKLPLTVDESMRGMLKVLSSLSEKDTSTFLDWEGKVIPW
uniref:C-factor n=1 Tax=Strigops habroptila TaxID=2489341 RepID=A0A672TGI6_STRHB